MKRLGLLACLALMTCSWDDGSANYTPQQFSCHIRLKQEVASVFAATFVRSDATDYASSAFSSAIIDQFGKDRLSAVSFLEKHGISNDRDLQAVKRAFDQSDTANAQALFAAQVIRSVDASVALTIAMDQSGRRQTFTAACLTLIDGTTHVVVLN